jgi:hypothetical protein
VKLTDNEVLSAFGCKLFDIPMNAKFNPARDIQVVPWLQDPAPFHALMAVSAFAQHRLCKTVPGPEALSHKLKAIRIINERLSRNEMEVSTIRAVELLWTLEVRSILSYRTKHYLTLQALFDDEKRLQAHLDGLQQMITRKGGIPSLPPSIQLALTWYATIIDEFSEHS